MQSPRAPSAPQAAPLAAHQDAASRPAGRPARLGVGLPPPAAVGDAAALRLAAERLKAMAKTLRPHELVAMLASHYARARTAQRPRVATTLQVLRADGRNAVTVQV